MENLYCIDLLDEQYSNKLSDILFKLHKKMEDSQTKNNLIIEYIEIYNNLNKNNIYVPDKNTSKEETETKETKEGILSKIIIYHPSNLIEMIKDLIKDNIFFNDLDTDRKNKYNLALNIVESYKKSAFWWGLIPIKWFSESSRKRMVKELNSIYEIVVKKREKENNKKEYSEIDCNNRFLNFIKNMHLIPSNKEKTSFIGKEIVEEFDKDYAKINLVDQYYHIAQKLNQNFNKFKEFSDCFKQNNWYDINIHDNDN